MQIKDQGFEQEKEDNNPNKGQLIKPPNNQYFIVPDAKPILPKTYIDMNKPKVLIRQINITKEPLELIIGRYMRDNNNSKSIKKRKVDIDTDTTIWAKYIISQQYQCVYLKYYKDNLPQLIKKGFKKFKLELQKLIQYSQYVFSTYIIDLSFINDVGTYLLRNLQQTNLSQLSNQPTSDTEVAFDSKFQCGNLFAAFKKYQDSDEYDLILQTDVNTKGYSNWFYFSIRSTKKRVFRLNIVNMQKRYSFFSLGMKIALFSSKQYEYDKLEWHRGGYDFNYYRNDLLKGAQNTQQTLHTLSFTIDQKYDDDLIFVAFNYPYSYSKLLRYIDSIQKIAKLNSHIYLKKDNIAKTISSNFCPIITLTWKRDKKNDETSGRKKIIALIARQHPCQTVSSFVMEGFINSLLYLNNEYSVQLLKKYIFKIIPMINIDGVIYGNSRCDISGTDVNRKWIRNPNSFLYPVIHNVKGLFHRLTMEGYEIQYFFDLHGHSKRLGSFIYGCKTFDEYQNKQFSWIMSKINNKFLFQECSFGISNFKKQTARSAMSSLVLNKKSMTLQTSFFGYKTSNGTKHFQIKDLHQLGQNILQAIHAQQFKTHKMINFATINNDIKNYVQQESLKQNQQQSNSGSDSDPSIDEMLEKQRQQLFLPIQVAQKIGLVESKITQKKQQRPRKQSSQVKLAFQQIQLHESLNNNLQSMFDTKNSDIIQRYSQKPQKIGSLKQSKSITKITPFKFTERFKRNQSQSKPKIRIAIDIYHNRPEHDKLQRLSVPKLIALKQQEKHKFWQEMNKQFQLLVNQKKKKANLIKN